MQNFGNERYSQEEFVYGIEPNRFFKENLVKFSPGKILLPAEGEGRNASFAAKLGWEVFAFDSSNVAMEKANKLFDSNNVKVNYFLQTLEYFALKKNFLIAFPKFLFIRK
ncbi:MAG: class I SAM-dependent methyltransferase [Melioribacteraceae bacterium]